MYFALQFEEEGQVNPLKYMCDMRSDRGGTVQTPVRMSLLSMALSLLFDLSVSAHTSQ